jgi:succinoglycan biosynthesis protein ExoL
MRITYFANDLSDAAISRRVELLQLGGAELTIIGFRRTTHTIDHVAGVPALDLGQTHDARLYDRAWKVFSTSLRARQWKSIVRNSDILLARNMDMVFVAHCARAWASSDARLAYECLDIHGSLLKTNALSGALRKIDAWLLNRSDSLLVSSPAFIVHYFDRLGVRLPPVIVAENKRISVIEALRRPDSDPNPHGPPWKIGWFGNLRCPQSFTILHKLAAQYPDLIDIEMRGRPTALFRTLLDEHRALPNMRFAGAYAQSDLADLYGSRDLTWAVDTWQSGQNSEWLLPNRIYEGGFFNCPPVTLDGTETANWLTARSAGVLLQNLDSDLEAFITTLTPTRYQTLKRASEAVPTDDLVYSVEECRSITRHLSSKLPVSSHTG